MSSRPRPDHRRSDRVKVEMDQQTSGTSPRGGKRRAVVVDAVPTAERPASGRRATAAGAAATPRTSDDVTSGAAGGAAASTTSPPPTVLPPVRSPDRASLGPPAVGEHRRDVVFRTAADQGGERVAVVGEFNDWSISTHPMVRRGDHFELVVSLAPGRYRFRYLVDGHRWENDWQADAYEPNAFGGEDSVVVVDLEERGDVRSQVRGERG